MSKRDRYRDEPDWDIVSKAYDERAAAIQAHQMRDLMMPSDYERTRRHNGRTRHY